MSGGWGGDSGRLGFGGRASLGLGFCGGSSSPGLVGSGLLPSWEAGWLAWAESAGLLFSSSGLGGLVGGRVFPCGCGGSSCAPAARLPGRCLAPPGLGFCHHRCGFFGAVPRGAARGAAVGWLGAAGLGELRGAPARRAWGGGLCPDGAAARLGGRFGLLGPGVAGSGFCLLLVAAFFWVWVWVRWGSVWWLVGLLLLSSSGRVVAGVVCRCLPLSAVVCRGRGRQTGPGALLRRLLPLGFGGVGWGCLAPPCGPFARRVSP